MNHLSNILCLLFSLIVAALFLCVGAGVTQLELAILLFAVLYTCVYIAPDPLKKLNRKLLRYILYSSMVPLRKNEEAKILMLAQFVWVNRTIHKERHDEVVLDMYERQVNERYDPYGPIAMLLALFILGTFNMSSTWCVWTSAAIFAFLSIPHIIDIVDGFRSPVALRSLRKEMGHNAETVGFVLQQLSTSLDVFSEWLPANKGYEVHEFMRQKIYPLMRSVGATWAHKPKWTSIPNRERYQDTIALLHQTKL
jgi:hypothetical protein